MIVPLVETGVHRSGVDRHFNRAGALVAIDDELAGSLAETAVHGGKAEMVDGEVGEGMERIDSVGFLRRKPGQRQHGQCQYAQAFLHWKNPPLDCYAKNTLKRPGAGSAAATNESRACAARGRRRSHTRCASSGTAAKMARLYHGNLA